MFITTVQSNLLDITYLPTLPILAVGYRFQGLSTAYRFYRPILPHFNLSMLSAHKDKIHL